MNYNAQEKRKVCLGSQRCSVRSWVERHLPSLKRKALHIICNLWNSVTLMRVEGEQGLGQK